MSLMGPNRKWPDLDGKSVDPQMRGHPICAFKSTRPAYTTHPARLAFGFGMKKMLEAAFPPMSKH